MNRYKTYWKRGLLANQKGQGIVEFAILLAFCAIIGYTASSLGFISTMDANYGKKAAKDYNSSDIIKNETKVAGNLESVSNVSGIPEPPDWGKLQPGDFSSSNSLTRLASDQLALGNLGEIFMGKTKAYIQSNYTNLGITNGSILLGWFRKDTDGSMYFAKSQLKQSNVENIFRWIQGDYGEGGYTATVDPFYRYLVSDYVTANFENPINQAKGGNGVRMRLFFDETTNEVNKVIIAIDRASQKDKNGSAGLEVTITPEGRTVTAGGLEGAYKLP